MIILRVDVDLPYRNNNDYVYASRNGLLGDLWRRAAYYSRGYYRSTVELAEFFTDNGVQATFFLSDRYLPPPQVKQSLTLHDIGIHVSTGDVDEIKQSRKKIETLLDRKIDKLSVHTTLLSDEHRETYIGLLKNGFKLFSDNLPPSTPQHTEIGGGYYIPGMLCTRISKEIPLELQLNMRWLEENASNTDIVVCTHPVELENRLTGTTHTKSKLKHIADSFEAGSFEQWIRRKEGELDGH